MHAQESRATIQGTVQDASGAVVPGAMVSATNTATGVTVNAKVNGDGIFQILFLNPGTYDIAVEAPGFKKYVRAGYLLQIADQAKLDVKLQNGDAKTETVTVEGTTPLLQAESASTSITVENKTIVDAPISGGDVGTLVLISPAVTDVAIANHPYELTSVGVASRIVVAGVRSQNTEFTVDGTPAMSTDSAAYVPPSDMVQEVKIETNSYNAQYGHSAGGYFNTITKSGTNSLHGTAYEYHTDGALLSMNLFQRNQYNNPATGALTDAKYKSIKGKDINNRFGASLGGPIIIPKIYNGRDKTFWNFGYEGFRHISTDANSGSFFTVPTVAERSGDLSALLPLGCANGNAYNSATGLCANGTASTYQIYDPNSTTAVGNGTYKRNPFPFNMIPANRIDAVAKALLNFYPLPNNPPTSAAGAQNYFHPVRGLSDYDIYTARIDHNFSQKEKVYGRFNYGTLHGFDEFAFANAATQYFNYGAITGAAIDNVYVFNATTVLDVRYGFLRKAPSSATPPVDLTQYGVPANVVALIPQAARVFPRLTIDGSNFTTANANAPTDGPNTNDHSVTGDLTKNVGRHSLTIGGDFRIYQTNNYTLSNSNPYLTFNGTYTNGPLNTSATATVGQGLASFLLGIPSTGTIIQNTSYAYTSRYFGGYIQDNFKINPRLTLTAGVRYEYETAPTERYNRSVQSFDPNAVSPVGAAAVAKYNSSPITQIPVGQFKVAGGLTFVGVNGNGRGLWSPDKNNIAPRVGLVYQVDQRTIFRGGYGVFYIPKGADRFGTAQDRNVVNQLGFSQTTTIVASTDNGQTYTATLENLFPNGILTPTGAAGGAGTGLGGAVSYYNPQQVNPLIQRWSAGFQRELPQHLFMDVEYIASSGMHLGVVKQEDAIPRQYLSTSPTRDNATNTLLNGTVANPFYPLLPGTSLGNATVARSQLLLPYPQFTGVTHNAPLGSTIYHALAVTTVRRFSGGFSLQASYTWSKFLQSTEFLNASDPLPTKVISDQDIPQRFSIATIFDVPVGRGRRFGSHMNGWETALLGGWQVSTIWAAQSGTPLGFGNALLAPGNSFKTITLPKSQQTVNRWFNTQAFDTVSTDQLVANVITFPLRLPDVRTIGIDNVNASAMKYFKLWEGAKLQFRCEAMNAGNHSQLAAPVTSVTSTTFGTISSVQSVARQIFFAGKLIF